MTIHFNIYNNLHHCIMQITDARSTRYFKIPVHCFASAAGGQTMTVECDGGELDLLVYPESAPPQDGQLNFDPNTWKGKLLNKMERLSHSVIGQVILSVGCRYRITDVCDGDVINIYARVYGYNSEFSTDVLELLPVLYTFYEAESLNGHCTLINSFAGNRKTVIQSARKLTCLLDFGLRLLIIYPIQVGRVKRLTSKRKVRKTILKFLQLPPEKRREYIN